MAAMAQALSGASQHRTVAPRRRVLLAGAFVIALVATGFLMFPRRHAIALADVARAMANVRSAHFVVQGMGGESLAEVWVKGPDKCLIREEGGLGAVDDGQRTVSFERRGGTQMLAVVQPPRRLSGIGELGEGMTYLDWLSGPGLTQSILETGGAKLIATEVARTPDGRAAVNATLAVPTPSGPTPEKMVITVDTDTDLVIAWERFIAWERPGEGHGGLRVDRIDYDVEMPDSLFSIDIPEDAVVVDLLTPPSGGLTARGQALAREARSNGGDVIFRGGPDHSWGGSCGSAYHTKLRFQFLDRNATEIYYLLQWNMYYVSGRVLASMSDGSGFSQILEDQRFEAPTSPDSTPEQRDAEVQDSLAISAETVAQRDAKEKELRAAGAVSLSKLDGSMGTCGSLHRGMFFKAVDKSGFRQYYFPDRNTYYVIGKALVWCADWQKTVEDAEVEAPGPTDREQ